MFPTATINLTSSVVGQACPGEVVTYTCMVDQAAALGWTAAPVLTDPTAVVFVATAPSNQRTRDCSTISSIQCSDLDFYATFRNVSAVQNGLADLTSTFSFTVTAELNRTVHVVQCFAATESGTLTAIQRLIVAGKYMQSLVLPSHKAIVSIKNNFMTFLTGLKSVAVLVCVMIHGMSTN